MKNIDKTNVKKEHCIHTFAAKILMEMSDPISLNVVDKDKIFVVQENPYFVAVVYPKENRYDSKTRPGVIVKTARMTKTRCRTCKGRDNCFHLNIFKKAESEDKSVENCESDRLAEEEINAKETGIETDLIDGCTDKKPDPKGKSKSKNEYNPANFHGNDVNVFGQQFDYPPTPADKEKNNKINKVEALFPSKMMIPSGLNIERCKCGNVYDVKKHESSHPVIHHGKPTKDSRNSILSVYFLETKQCACKRFYHGT